ncbi:MAG: 4-alpha-glucanotransferase [Chloroflexi bacterium RBG_13_56_8]|nr:MAG: 4-alpha-glucanotransferase [Chloroflexi bacterium RBG_13_56_8]
MPLLRKCGILCHPTSLPGRFGIGELGEHARRFLDFLAAAGQSIWQVLPLGPTGYGDSPYQPFSAFAGNHLLISLDQLIEEGLLSQEDVAWAAFPQNKVLYGPVIEFKDRVLRRSYQNYVRGGPQALQEEMGEFRERAKKWLDDYALFMALKGYFGGVAWINWEPDIALRQTSALEGWRDRLHEEVEYHCYLQFQFDRQWRKVRRYAHEVGISVMGDVPIFVGHDSADVWSHRELFWLDEKGNPTVVAGVPPDYFSPTGQLWGNPLYRWGLLERNNYAWWVDRLRAALAQVDVVRLDHFRGFGGYWEVPADEETAVNGRWVRGPGECFFQVVRSELGTLPFVAEDLGIISVDVAALREKFGLPGMGVLQFAFDSDAASPYLPHNHTEDSVIYTGTHDNDTTLGWYASVEESVRHRVRVYAGSDGSDINWAFIRMAMNSVARMAIIPLQDVLGLGSEARLNQPGREHGNWTWRYRLEMLRPELAGILLDMASVSGRWVAPGTELGDPSPTVLEYEEPEMDSAN